MKEKTNVKVNLKTILALLFILMIVIVSMVIIVINLFKINSNSNSNNSFNQIEENKQEGEITVIDDKNIKNDFDFSFLKIENKNKNIIYSPLSIKYALKMLNEAAEGRTKEQIESVLGNIDLTKYENIEKVLSFANCIYIRDDYSNYINENYKNVLKEKFDAEINYDEFENAKNVNTWIENKTLGIIKNMLADEMFLDKDLKMLLINALAIDMEWENKFSEEDTRGRDFILENGEKVLATTMSKKTSADNIKYYQDESITSLTMPLKEYENVQLEFMAIMPNENLSSFVEKISTEKINEIYKKQKSASSTNAGINIFIPKFSYEYDLKLKEDLQSFGIKDAFDKNLADFNKMTNSQDERLYVGKALHKANIDFTEKGVKAAAVTVFEMMKATAFIQEEKPIEIKIDKPFMFVIKDKKTNEIWFTGTVYNPNLWENDKEDYKMRF